MAMVAGVIAALGDVVLQSGGDIILTRDPYDDSLMRNEGIRAVLRPTLNDKLTVHLSSHSPLCEIVLVLSVLVERAFVRLNGDDPGQD